MALGLQLGMSGSSEITNLTKKPLRCIEATGRIWTGITGVNDTVNLRRRYFYRIPVIMGVDASVGCLAFGAWWLNVVGYNTSAIFTDPGTGAISEYTVVACAVEGASSGTVPVTFGGSRSKFIARDTTVLSDEFAPPAGTKFKRSSKYWIKLIVETSAVDNTRGFPRAVGRDVILGSTGQAYRYNPDGVQTLSNIDTYGDFTGTAVTGGNTAAGGGTPCPIFLGRPTTDVIVTAALRDSIGEGTGTSGDTAQAGQTYGIGFVTRSFTNSGGDARPLLNLSKSGAGTQMLTLPHIEEMLQYVNAIEEGMCVNDFNAGTAVATVLSTLSTAYTRWRNVFGITQILRDGTLPYTTGTFTDEAGQTVKTVSSVSWTTFENAFNTGIAGMITSGLVDAQTNFTGVRGTDTTKWAANNTIDGLHPNSTGVNNMIPTNLTAIQSR